MIERERAKLRASACLSADSILPVYDVLTLWEQPNNFPTNVLEKSTRLGISLAAFYLRLLDTEPSPDCDASTL